MTSKRDTTRKPKKDERPKVKKETVKDLDAPERKAEDVRGGSQNIPIGGQR